MQGTIPQKELAIKRLLGPLTRNMTIVDTVEASILPGTVLRSTEEEEGLEVASEVNGLVRRSMEGVVMEAFKSKMVESLIFWLRSVRSTR